MKYLATNQPGGLEDDAKKNIKSMRRLQLKGMEKPLENERIEQAEYSIEIVMPLNAVDSKVNDYWLLIP